MNDNTTIPAENGNEAFFGFILKPGKTENSAYIDVYGSGISKGRAAQACLAVAIDCLRKGGATNTQIVEEFQAELDRAGIYGETAFEKGTDNGS